MTCKRIKPIKRSPQQLREIAAGTRSDVVDDKLNSTWLQIGRGEKTLEDLHRVQSELERYALRVAEFNTALAACSDEDGQEDE